MSSTVIKIGIIGGSGLDDPDILEHRKETSVSTPYGLPSDVIIEGEISGVPCALLARHGRNHSIAPSQVNYRANISALKNIGCTHVIVSTATGSLQDYIKPGDIVIPDDFIDRTTKREGSFFAGSGALALCHLPMFPAFSEKTRKTLIDTAEELGYSVHKKGTVVTIEGPRFSSRAESRMYRQWGGEIINMTTCPEVILAKEMSMLYGAVAIATDYDCWREGCESVNVADVLKTFAENVSIVKEILIRAVVNISKQDWTEDLLKAKKLITDSLM